MTNAALLLLWCVLLYIALSTENDVMLGFVVAGIFVNGAVWYNRFTGRW